MSGEKRFWTAAETADELGISLGHLYNEKHAGRIAATQRGHGCRLRFTRAQIDAYAEGRDALTDELAARRAPVPALRPTPATTARRVGRP